MIDLSSVTDADIGRGVVYWDPGAKQAEDGILVAYNSVYLFVRYKGDNGSKATRPEDADWLGSK